jgi:CheY-like chemotaxis protein
VEAVASFYHETSAAGFFKCPGDGFETVKRIHLPTTSHRAHAPKADESDPRHYKVLCVEDEVMNMSLMREVLKLRPMVRLFEATSGEAALIIAEAERPDLILLDRRLPDMSGEAVLRKLRERPGTKTTPVLIVSADTARPNSEEAQLGVSGYVTKPYGIMKLLEQIDALLN